MGKNNQIVKNVFSFIRSEKRYDEEFIKNKFKKFAKEFALYIDGRNYSAVNRMISESSKLRFNTKLSKANKLISKLIDINFKKFFFIEIADIYKIDNKMRIATGFYWAISSDYKIELRKKDISLFVNEDSNKIIKSSIDGFISAEKLNEEIICGSNELKIYVTEIVNYYNQKIIKIKTINNSNFRWFFRAGVDKARVRIYGQNIYEEKELSINGEYPRISEFREENEFKLISNSDFDNRINAIEIFNIYNEQDIGKFNHINYMVFSREDLDKNKIDNEVKNIKRMIEKLLNVKTLEDFYDITDREVIKKYYKEIIGIDEFNFECIESELLQSYRTILSSYKFMELESVEFEDLFYNLKIKFEFGRKKGVLDIYLNKSNDKLIFSEEYLLMLREDRFKNVILNAVDCFNKEDIKFAYYPIIKKLLIAVKIDARKIFSERYFRVDVYDGVNNFSSYLKFSKIININNIKCNDDFENEYARANILRDNEFIYTSMDINSLENVEKIVITDNSMFMLTLKNNIRQINGI